MNRDKKWLEKELKRLGINDVSEVFFATLETSGKLYIDKYRDHIKSKTDISDYDGPY